MTPNIVYPVRQMDRAEFQLARHRLFARIVPSSGPPAGEAHTHNQRLTETIRNETCTGRETSDNVARPFDRSTEGPIQPIVYTVPASEAEGRAARAMTIHSERTPTP